jgi:hypothetical protein
MLGLKVVADRGSNFTTVSLRKEMRSEILEVTKKSCSPRVKKLLYFPDGLLRVKSIAP